MMDLFRKATCALGWLVFLVAMAGCNSDGGGSSSSRVTGKTKTVPMEAIEHFLEFRVGDKVFINFSGTITPPPNHQESVKEDGTLTLPLIGNVEAAGLTAKELEESIHNKYVPDYYRRLTVTVLMQERHFWVSGEVKQPGMLPYLGETTVLKCITAAGDFTDFADERKVELTRANGQIYTVNCREAQKRPELDLPVYPGDRIEVKRRLF